eukprot:11463937-Alexandrium_andersonii.AAC.1
MSASLVGSEMCIRDSAKGPLGPLKRPDSAKSWRTRQTHSPAPCWGVAAVSYTHLTLPTICSV